MEIRNFDIEFNNNKITKITEIELEAAKKKSTKAPKIELPKKYKSIAKNVIASGLISLLSISATLGAMEFTQTADKTSYRRSHDYVSDNTVYGSSPDEYWYKTENIANEIYEKEAEKDYDKVLYATYLNIDWNKNITMSEVIRALSTNVDDNSEYKKYNGFNDYLINNGFVTNGKVDTKKYEEVMDQQIALSQQSENIKSGGK